MRTVEVLLRENVADLGRCGDVVRVAAGYARNYLLPQRLAIEASAEGKRQMSRRRQQLEQEESQRVAVLEERAAAIAELRLTIRQRADDQGRLYGSVTQANVAELLAAAGHPTAASDVRMDAHLKSVGEHRVAIHLYGERSAELVVVVEAEG